MTGADPRPDADGWIDRLTDGGLTVRPDEPMAPRCTYRVGGAARALVEVTSENDLATVGRVRSRWPMPVAVVGNGSNLLVDDAGFDGLVLVMGESMADVEIDNETVICGAGALLPVVARRSVAHGLTGFEWAVGVPGSIGGAVRMNAGGHGADMSESLAEVRVVDLDTGQDVTMPAADLHLSYRSSSIAPHQAVTSATLRLARGDAEEGARRLREIVAWRRENQPGGANAGSVFTNPPGDSAGRLIDATGLRGRRVGGASVSEKHANFIRTDPGATAADVLDLMAVIRDEVRLAHGVDLVAETKTLGVGRDRLRRAGVGS